LWEKVVFLDIVERLSRELRDMKFLTDAPSTDGQDHVSIILTKLWLHIKKIKKGCHSLRSSQNCPQYPSHVAKEEFMKRKLNFQISS